METLEMLTAIAIAAAVSAIAIINVVLVIGLILSFQDDPLVESSKLKALLEIGAKSGKPGWLDPDQALQTLMQARTKLYLLQLFTVVVSVVCLAVIVLVGPIGESKTGQPQPSESTSMEVGSIRVTLESSETTQE